MAQLSKKAISERLNEIYPVRIDWTKLSINDLKKFLEVSTALEETLQKLTTKEKLPDAVPRAAEPKTQGRLFDGTILDMLMKREGIVRGDANSDGRINRPIIDALKKRTAAEIESTSDGTGVVAELVRSKVKDALLK